MIIVGIDPGVTGALARYEGGVLDSIADMPTFDGRIDAIELEELLTGTDIAYIENQHPMPKNGSIASFKLGMNFGIVVCMVEHMGIQLVRIPASTWKRWNGLLGKNKEASVQLCRELWPNMREHVRLAKHHNRAEAALIARYGHFKQIHEGAEQADETHTASVSELRGSRERHPSGSVS
jgi:hypothetical protein